MAKQVKLVSLATLDSKKKEVDAAKASGDKDKHKEVYGDYRRLVKARTNQLAHPVYGPQLKAIDSAVSLGNTTPEEPAAPKKRTTVRTKSTNQVKMSADDEDPMARIQNSLRNPNKWVTPGEREHFDRMTSIARDVDHWANSIEDSIPGGTRNVEDGHPLLTHHKLMNDVYKHLDHHADAHENGDGTVAAQHLNAAATSLGKAIHHLKQNYGSQATIAGSSGVKETDVSAATRVPVIEQIAAASARKPRQEMQVPADKLLMGAVKTAADYATTYGSGTAGRATTPSKFGVEFKLPENFAGFNAPDKSQMTAEEKKMLAAQSGKEIGSAEYNERSYLPPRGESPREENERPSVQRVRQRFGIGGESVNEEEFPLHPKQMRSLADFTTGRQYSRSYGRELAKTIAQTREQVDAYNAARRADRIANPSLYSTDVSESTRQQVTANRRGAIKYKVEKSLVPLDGDISSLPAETQKTVNAHLDYVSKHLRRGGSIDELPTRVQRELGPKGLDMAMERHLNEEGLGKNEAPDEMFYGSDSEPNSREDDVTTQSVMASQLEDYFNAGSRSSAFNAGRGGR